MRFESTFLIAATVVIVHFILGVGFLIYKVMTADRKSKSTEDENVGE